LRAFCYPDLGLKFRSWKRQEESCSVKSAGLRATQRLNCDQWPTAIVATYTMSRAFWLLPDYESRGQEFESLRARHFGIRDCRQIRPSALRLAGSRLSRLGLRRNAMTRSWRRRCRNSARGAIGIGVSFLRAISAHFVESQLPSQT